VCNFLKNLFPKNWRRGKRKSQTIKINPDDLAVNDRDQSNKTQLRVASCQSTGRERSHNEDTIFSLYAQLDGLNQPLPFGIFLVADGMGGHQSGEVASNLASKAVSQTLMRQVYDEFLFEGDDFSDEEILISIRSAIDDAQKLISARVPGGGTTLTLVLVLGERLFFGHVGDCRLYTIYGKGTLHLHTKDHSLTKRLVDLGEITEKEARTHPQRNVLYRALGQTDPFEPDIKRFDLEDSGRFMICSDGLWGTLTDGMMESVIQEGVDLQEIACNLVLEANKAGGPDNISVTLVEEL